MLGPQFAVLFLVKNNLLKQQIPVVDLTEEVDLEFLVALHQLPIVFVNLLCHLGHGLQAVLESLLGLSEVFIVFLHSVVLVQKLLLVPREIAVELGPEVLFDTVKVFFCVFLEDGDARVDLVHVLMDLFDSLVRGHAVTITSIAQLLRVAWPFLLVFIILL